MDNLLQEFAWQALWLLVTLAFIVQPIAAILKRLGLSPLWSLLSLIPLVNIIALNVLARQKWPIDKGLDA